MPSGNPVIKDSAVIARIDSSKPSPVGEAFRKGDSVPTHPMAPQERADMVARLEGGIEHLMTIAKNNYKVNCFKPGTRVVDPNYIERLSTNEFFFYTKEPLSMEEFEKLQNRIAEKAKTLPSGVQLILGSFAVKTDDGKVMNVTPHITCGKEPEFNFIVKNYTSSIDVRYKIPDGKGQITKLRALDVGHPSMSMPTIKVNGEFQEFTFNNVVRCKTPGGAPFITVVDICLDHRYGVGKTNLAKLLTENPGLGSLPISHVVVSNCVDLKKENCLTPKIMHVDPIASRIQCKEGVAQEEGSWQKFVFGKDRFKILDVKPMEIAYNCKGDKILENRYAHKTLEPSNGRKHSFTADFKSYKGKYQGLLVDHLKTKILEDFKIQIESTSSPSELAELKIKLESTHEYTVLKTGQDTWTRITGCDTSSKKALDGMFKAHKENLEKRPAVVQQP